MRQETTRRGTRGGFDLRLLVCPSCRAYLATYKETIDLAHDAPPELIEAALTSKSLRSKS